MKRAILKIDDHFLINLLKGLILGPPRSFTVIKNALPGDVKPIRCMIMNSGLLGILIESDSFEDVTEGSEYPILDLPVLAATYE